MTKKPMVGVLPLFDEDKESIWMLPGYLDCLQQAGALPVILPQRAENEDLERFLEICDGFLFTGGHDVNPALYGEEPVPETVWNEERDALEAALFRPAYERDVPLLGICRGIQFFNAALGGTLYQDLPTQFAGTAEHHMEPPYDRTAHSVTLTEGAPLRALLGRPELGVNSYHHQAVRRLAPPLREMARSEDGLVEAVCDPSRKFLWAVQWHPEFSWRTDDTARRIVGAFVRACAEKAGEKHL